MSEFIFVNKNPLIPVIINNITKQKALTMIMDQAFNQNNEYCKNIYFISFCSNNTFQIYFTNGKGKKYFIKRSNSNNIEEYDIDSFFCVRVNFICVRVFNLLVLLIYYKKYK